MSLVRILLLGLLLAAGCAVEPEHEGGAGATAGSGRGARRFARASVEELPLCSELDLSGVAVTLYLVEGTGGLYVAMVDGEFVCLDDAVGLESAGVEAETIAEAPANGAVTDDLRIIDPKSEVAGTPLPAHHADGTPLPATR